MTPEVRRKVEERMRTHGEDWWTACGFFGRRGGFVSGIRRASRSESVRKERSKQEAMGLR